MDRQRGITASLEKVPEERPLTRGDVLEIDDQAIERVEVPEWGGFLHVRTLTGTERDFFEASCLQMVGSGAASVNLRNMRAKLVAMTACDQDGKSLFRGEDVKALGKKSGAALDRVFSAAQRLNRLTDEDVETLVKNSAGGRNGSSGSA